jgi:hypothetical protein
MLKLYWVTTEDHHEDWFVAAPSAAAAERFFEEAEGYGSGEANADEIIAMPEADPSEVGWPSHERLTAHGARILREETPRAVEIGGRTFGEGMLQGIIDELQDDRFKRLDEA